MSAFVAKFITRDNLTIILAFQWISRLQDWCQLSAAVVVIWGYEYDKPVEIN